MSSKTYGKTSSRRLARGQVWQLRHAYVQIVELGRRVLQYRMMDSLHQQGIRTQISGIDVMWDYLTSRQARLLKSLERQGARA